MSAKAYVMGHEIYSDGGAYRYVDTDEIFTGHCDRPCTKCGERVTPDDHDPCIANLPGVVNACCGHGIQLGYIEFTDGRVIRGEFAIE